MRWVLVMMLLLCAPAFGQWVEDPDALRRLPVDAQVRSLDTLARQTVARVTGGTHAFVRAEDGALHRVTAAEAFLEWAIAPSRARDDPIIRVDALPLRREIDQRIAMSVVEQDVFRAHGLLTPDATVRVFEEVGGDAALAESLGRLEDRLLHFIQARQRLEDATGGAWTELEQPWVSHDSASLAAAVDRMTVDASWRVSLELLRNDVPLTAVASWLFAIGAIVLLLMPRGAWVIVGVVAFAAGLCAQLLSLAMRAVVAGRLPLQNQYESLAVLAFVCAAIGGVWAARARQRHIAIVSAGAAFCMLLIAEHAGVPGVAVEQEPAILATTSLLAYHVAIMLLAYGVIVIGGVLGAMALWRCARQRDASDLSAAVRTAMHLSFWTLGVGILLGAWWAERAWGRWWAFDAKETWALITWLVYLVGIHMPAAERMPRRRRDGWTAVLAILGLLCMVWTYFGVNLLMNSLHAYA
jgi:ABC-type transport system involved in cytochrome c biogenesis permease subunit